MTRTEIVAVFDSIADVMQIRGDERGRILMYRRLARILDTLQEDINLLYERNELAEIPGIGPSTVEKIGELIATGRCEYYEELKASVPPGVMDLMSVSGVGPSTAAKLYHELDIDSLESLQQALDAQKLRDLKGMGKRTEEKIRAGMEALLRHRQRKLMGHVLPQAQAVVDILSGLESVEAASLAGELRRKTETVKDALIVGAGKGCAEVREALARTESIAVVADDWTDSGGSARLVGDVDLRVMLTDAEDFGAALLYFTGSEGHVAVLNNRARQLGLEPFESESCPVWAKSMPEAGIYAALGLPFIAPELREKSGEIQAASAGQLPNLISVDDIRGDLHVHSTWSDGNETMQAMAEAARKLGYEYVALCDHSISSKIANGLSVKRILSKIEEVKELNEEVSGIEILMGGEVDILKDGSLDYPDEVLARLDVVVASIHSGFNMDEATMTRRIISAIENRYVHIFGHPTGRLLSRRDPYQVDIDALIDAAADNNTSLEINSYPERLDLKDVHARRAKERNAMLAINTDAHSTADLDLLVYGIYTARRAWVERKDVLNALPLGELMKVISSK